MEHEKNTAASAREMVTISRAEYEELKLQNQWLLEQLGLAKKRQFGVSSERLQEGLMDQLSLMANEAEAYAYGTKNATAEQVAVKAHARKRQSGNVLDIVPEGTPTEVVEHRLSEEERTCDTCGAVMEEIGKEVRRSLKMEPARFWIREDVYYTYACKQCEAETGEGNLRKTPKQPALCPGSFASPEAVAHIMTQKFVMYAPLYQKWWELQCQVNEFYSGKKQQRPPLSKQKEFRAIRNAVIREAENMHLGKITFEDEKMEERGEWVDNWEVSYECLRLRARIEDNKLPLDQRDEAVEDLERLTEHGDVHAQYFLGLLYRDGGLLLPDTEQAAHWLELAAKRDLPAAQYALGKLYLSDDPEVHDVDDGIQWLERAARNGNTDAAYRLGKEYLTGKSVQKDAVKAATHLRYAANQNHPWASYLMGKLYLTGNGVPKDEEAAWNCFRMANAYGYPYARYVLERQEQWQRPELLLTVSRLLYHMSNIFRDNAPTVPAQPRLHIDRKRMRELQELRIALGHQPDDHEEEQTQTQTWGGMTMKGR